MNAELTEDTLGLTSERFGFTMFMSVCVHAMLILGVGFTVANQPVTTTSMDITLAQFRSEEAPEDVDFLAQANQLGSGTEDDKLAPASDEIASFSDTVIRDVSEFLQERPTSPVPVIPDSVIATQSDSAQRNSEQLTDPDTVSTEQPIVPTTQPNLSDEVASLQAQLDLHRQAYAKRPRRYTMTSASTKADEDAQYLENWRKRIEGIGNLNYPEAASSEGIYGTLRVMVSLKPDGTVHDIRILRSSGEAVLDEAAIRIVQLAAPFAPFPDHMKAKADILEIIRTWQFHRGNTFTSF